MRGIEPRARKPSTDEITEPLRPATIVLARPSGLAAVDRACSKPTRIRTRTCEVGTRCAALTPRVCKRTTRIERASPGWRPGALPSELRPRDRPGWSRRDSNPRLPAASFGFARSNYQEPERVQSPNRILPSNGPTCRCRENPSACGSAVALLVQTPCPAEPPFRDSPCKLARRDVAGKDVSPDRQAGPGDRSANREADRLTRLLPVDAARAVERRERERGTCRLAAVALEPLIRLVGGE